MVREDGISGETRIDLFDERENIGESLDRPFVDGSEGKN
jgi:hypothetical protein